MCLLNEQDAHALLDVAAELRLEPARNAAIGPRRCNPKVSAVVQSAADLRTRLHDWFALRVHRGSTTGIGFLSRVSAPAEGTNRSLPIFDVSAFRTPPTMKCSAVRQVLAHRVH